MEENWALSSVFMFMDIRGCQDSNGDGLGDLPGLISRLDHFQEVGIGALVFAGLQPSDFSYVGTMMKEFSDVDPSSATSTSGPTTSMPASPGDPATGSGTRSAGSTITPSGTPRITGGVPR